MTSDPTRLLDDPSVASSLRDDLASAVQVEVAGLDLAGGLHTLQHATATSTPAAGSSLATKLGLGAALGGGAVVLWLALGGDPSPKALTPAAEPIAAVERSSTGVAPANEGAGELPEQPASARGDAPASIPSPVESPATVDPRAHEDVDPSAHEDTQATTGSGPRHDSSHGNRSRHDDAHDPPEAPAGDDVLREAQLVAKARAKLGREPAAALALAEEAERDFPTGQLVEERRAIAIRALLALGRVDEAQRRAEPFLATYGRGAHAAAVRRSLAEARPTSETDSPRP
ncbi:hypothetical protein [Paraliomyxa miuraensis]|uniref:hypothetical protein n=1 Tax=Paraliomyxa miuraensis TaxID=376150 RepID=UPI00224F6235|nr:hypothetical protein [Paraliomyxa miuraensis]MCX4242665.1 hypothetical protein [Paraliomyxa miuraensis]